MVPSARLFERDTRAMHYLYALRDRGGSWAIVRKQPIAAGPGLDVMLLGRCDEEQLAWDLFWTPHRLIRDGTLEVPRKRLDRSGASITPHRPI